jgi:predicted permease
MRRVFRLPFTRERIVRAVDEELSFHLEERIEEFVAQGMDRREAEAEARRRFGNYDVYRREASHIDERTMRTRHRLELLDMLAREVRHSTRVLLRTPAFSLIAFATLTLGLGATTAIFTVLEAVVLRPLPYRGANELVSVMHPTTTPGTGESKWGLSSAGYFFFKNESRTLADLGGYTTSSLTVVEGGDAEQIRVGEVTASIFSVLRARAALGRLITPDDDQPNKPPVVVLSDEYWRRRFGGDRNVVGRMLQTGGGPVQIIGVAEPGLNLPRPGPWGSTSDLATFHVDAWLPLQLNPYATPQNSHQYSGIGRLRAGATVAQSQAELTKLMKEFPTRFPTAYSTGFIEKYNFRVGVVALRDAVLGPVLTRTLWILFGAVALVLLIACANVANLFVVRMESRRRESAIRTALGADRAHMAAHFLSESLLLSLSAGLAAILVARAGLSALIAIAPTDIPRLGTVGMNWTIVVFTLALAIAAGIAFGVVPMFRRAVDVATLREGGRGLTSSVRQRRVRNGLVVGQTALAVVLLAAAGLMLRSFANLRNVKPGLDPRGVVVADIILPFKEYRAMEAGSAFFRELQLRVAALPGVQAVGATQALPLQDFGSGCAVVFRIGEPYSAEEKTPCVGTYRATPGFFRALGIQVRGAAPQWSDMPALPAVATKALTDRLWPGQDPIGKGIGSNGPRAKAYYTIVGVIPELRAHGLDQRPTEAVFYPPADLPRPYGGWEHQMTSATIVVRTTSGDPLAIVPELRRVVHELNPRAPLVNARTMQTVVDRSMGRSAFVMTLLGIAGAMALLLSAVGIYGVISYLVAQRRTEIGVRMALGARVPQVATLVLGQSLRLTVIGVGVGLLAAVGAMRLLQSLLFGVSPTDPMVYGVVTLMLLAIAAAASFGPARRAAAVDPLEALRGGG